MKNLDDVINGLQLKLHGLKQINPSHPKMTSVTSEEPREAEKGRGEGQNISMTDVLATSDFKSALRKFSQKAENSAIEVGMGSTKKVFLHYMV